MDGDCFFAACEVAKNPALRGKPVVVGQEKSIATALTYEAKARGVTRGMPIFQIKKICPEAIILPSDFDTYHLISKRMSAIVRRYCAMVEEYSIDECFADFSSGVVRVEELAYEVKKALARDTGITFSVGLAPTKVLAKVASKWKKPDGFTVITPTTAPEFLAKTPIGKIWGMGKAAVEEMRRHGIYTALDFVSRPQAWVDATFSKPYRAIWHELSGVSVYPVEASDGAASPDGATSREDMKKSIRRTHTFEAPSTDPARLLSELSKNAEAACANARASGILAGGCSFFIKTQDFTYHGKDCAFVRPTAYPSEIMQAITPLFHAVFVHGIRYRATGVTLTRLEQGGGDGIGAQRDLFGASEASVSQAKVFARIDLLTRKYGKHTVSLASSMKALHTGSEQLSRRGFSLPFLGEVH